jgi:hypothetical protein
LARLAPRPWQKAVARKQQRLLLRLIRETDGEVRDAIVKASRRVDKILRSLPGENISLLVRRAQFTQVRAALNKAIQEMWADDVSPSVLRGIERATSQALDANKDILAVLTRGLPSEAASLARAFSSDMVRSWTSIRARVLNSVNLSARVYKNAALTTGKIDAIVNEGLALQKSAKEIADDAVRYINPRVAGGPRYAATRLGRTEINNAAHTVNRLSYAESPYVDGVLWELSLSHPDVDDCDEFSIMDEFGLGEGVFTPESVPDKPHPQCYCSISPITISPEELGRRLAAGEYTTVGV